MSRFYGPQGHKIKNKVPIESTGIAPCEVVRFVLKSGQYLDLQLDTVEEVVDEFAGAVRICICGCKVEGEKVIFEWNNVDYLSEVE